MSDESIGRALMGAPSLSPLRVSGKTSLIRDVDGVYVVTERDLTDVVEVNKRLVGEKQNLRGTQRHWVHLANIPNEILYSLMLKFGHWKHNQEAWKRWLNDPDNRAFRTWQGNV